MPRRRNYADFPVFRVWNLTNQVVYLGVKTGNAAGVYLAPKGQPGDKIDLKGVDLSDRQTVRVLKSLVAADKIGIHQVSGFFGAYQIPTTSPRYIP